MLKKLLLVITATLLLYTFAGCRARYPYITVEVGSTLNSIPIEVGGDYRFWNFEKIINEDGSCCVIINFQPKNP